MSRTPTVIFRHAPPEEPASWRYKRVGGTITAAVTCPNGHRGDLANAFIGKRGDVFSVLVCPELDCDFDAHVRLEGWHPLEVIKDEDGSERVTLYPAHNRLADTERVGAFSFAVLMEKMKNVLLETAAQAAGEPEKWVPMALQRFRFMAIPQEELRRALPPGGKLPPPDEDGLVNMVAFIDANPALFPSLTNTNWRRPFDDSKLALPSLFSA